MGKDVGFVKKSSISKGYKSCGFILVPKFLKFVESVEFFVNSIFLVFWFLRQTGQTFMTPLVLV